MARRLIRFLRRPFSDQRLLMRAAWSVVVARLATRMLPFPSARAAARRLQPPGRFAASLPVERVIWAVDTASRAIPGMKNCLVQAMAAEAMLARAGHACELRIGAAKNEAREFVAHAWLESGGRVLIGEFEIERYTPMTAPPHADTPSPQR
jgi:hypothetical protein